MSYLWKNYSEKKNYIIGKQLCPYMEVINSDEKIVQVNPLLRFSKIFSSVLEEDNGAQGVKYIDEEELNKIVNIIFHYLAQLDMVKGLDTSQRVMEMIRNEIESGIWGDEIQKLWDRLSQNDREYILYTLGHRVQNNNYSTFMEAIGRLFPLSSLCYEEKTSLFYLYVGAKETDYNNTKMALIIKLFWTLNSNLKIIWNYHYGIIGCEDTMHIDSIQII